jgi:hypothetical protein
VYTKGGVMKKLLVLTIAVVLVIGSASLVQAGWCKWKNASQLCECYDDFFFETHGDCVSTLVPFVNEPNNGVVLFCKWWQDTWPIWFDAWFKNLGECISGIRSDK